MQWVFSRRWSVDDLIRGKFQEPRLGAKYRDLDAVPVLLLLYFLGQPPF